MSSAETKTAASPTKPFAIAAACSPGGVVDVGRPRRVVRPDAGELEAVQHVDRLVPDRLERRDRSVELHPDLRVLDGQLDRSVARADELRREHHRRRRRRPAARSSCGHPTGPPARRACPRARGAPPSVSDRASGTASAARRLEQERAEPLLGARHDDDPVGGVAVEHEGLLAVEDPRRALAPGAGADAVDRVTVADLLERDRAAQRSRRQRRQQVDWHPDGERRGSRAPPTRRRAPGTGAAPSPP